ncbi:hypothetical protein [Stutzerimonas urumqiensis]|uniref:hypothetical protein n=1 Tax=Stutzerimonas urumqiensis TaxID=638269 RepID=UPI0013CEC387|nr:hypothetical protein [Stutzerimonas urumqiensis]
MNYEEVTEALSPEDLRIDPSLQISDFNGVCSVNDYIPIPIDHLSSRYKSNETFDIKLNLHQQLECILISCKGEAFTYGEAPAILTAAYLYDITPEEVRNNRESNYTFKRNYVVLKSDAHSIYVAHYKNSSAIWGGFTHSPVAEMDNRIPGTHVVNAIPDLELPTAEHHTATLRAIYDPTPLGHYLALYHLIELSFDYDLVEDIKSLGADLKGIGKLLANYNNAEYQRLLRLVKKYWQDEASLAAHLEAFFRTSTYDAVIDELLYAYDKEGFPWLFKDDTQKRAAFIAHSKHSFTKQCISAAKFGWTLDHLQRSVAYIIYRFRCAIAHASIGEHILTINDSQMITEKAEPLLMGLISQMYKAKP